MSPRQLIREDDDVRVYEVSDAKGKVIGTDTESVVQPEPTAVEKLAADLATLKAQMAEVAKVPEVRAKVDLDTIGGG